MTNLPAGAQEPGAVGPWLANSLQNPETAWDWQDYCSRFPAAAGRIMRPSEEKCIELGSWDLSWLDLWVFFCVARRVSLERGRRGPDGVSDLTEQFEARAARFGVTWTAGTPPEL